MNNTAHSNRNALSNRTARSNELLADTPRLRLLPSRPSAPDTPEAGAAPAAAEHRPVLHLVEDPSPEEQPVQELPVLVAGRDSARRAAVLHDMTQTMPPETIFEQAGAFWEVLVRAPATSMVILSGELDDVPAESLLQMLAHRHPGLPVVSLDAPASPGEPLAYA